MRDNGMKMSTASIKCMAKGEKKIRVISFK